MLGDPPRIEPNVKVVECLLASNNVDLNIKDEVGTSLAWLYVPHFVLHFSSKGIHHSTMHPCMVI